MCPLPNSTRSEKVIFRSGGVSFCRPLSKFRRQEDQEKQESEGLREITETEEKSIRENQWENRMAEGLAKG